MEDPNFGFEISCNNCKGSGKVEVNVGLIKLKIETHDCSYCNGSGKMFVWYICPLFSSSERTIHNGFTDDDTIMNRVHCIGLSCLYWDRDHNGGCMKRKLLVKQLYG